LAPLRLHEARASLEDRIEPWTRCQPSRRAVAGDRGVDEARVHVVERLPAEAEPFHHAGAEVVDDDVRLAGEIEEDLAALGALQIEHERTLAAVPAEKGEGRRAE